MVCPRCIMAVEAVFKEFSIPISSIRLGEVITGLELNERQKNELDNKLKSLGFSLLTPGRSVIISEVKSTIIQQVHYAKEPLKVNFSAYLSEKLDHDYSYLSRLFSSVEGITIEKYIVAQKVERVKELLFYNEMTLSEIAWHLDYSSVAHLSSQFKKETGMTPTTFKKQRSPAHNERDKLTKL